MSRKRQDGGGSLVVRRRDCVTDFVLDTASMLVDRHALRAFDAVQLAGYMVLKGASGTDMPVFVCSDQELLMAAKQEGIPTLAGC